MRTATDDRVAALRRQLETMQSLNVDQGRHIAELLRERAETAVLVAQLYAKIAERDAVVIAVLQRELDTLEGAA
jgi:hypothetical protein